MAKKGGGSEPKGVSSQGASLVWTIQSGEAGGVSFYPKIPPKIEAMTMPRTTQQMMIMIFFCTREAGRKGLRAWERLEVGRAFRGSGLLGERTEGWRIWGADMEGR